MHSPFQRMLQLALPVLVEQLLVTLVAYVDQWLAGRFLEEPHLAAIGLVWYLLWLLPALFGVVAIGATALVARFTGAGDFPLANRVVEQSMLVGACVAVVVTIVTAWGAGTFVELMQLEAEAADYATRYLAIITPVIPAIMIQKVGIACLRGAGDTVSGFLTMSMVNLVNLVLGASLVTGWGPMPKWGIEGLALGTAVGHALGALMIGGFLIRGRVRLKLTRGVCRPDPPLIRRVLRIGVPGGADMIAVVSCHLWFLTIVNSLGTLEAAAHGLSVRIESLAYLPGTAFQVAAATMAGQYLGAGDERRAGRSVLLACLVGGAVMSAAGLLFFFQADPLTSFFLAEDNASVAQMAGPLLRLVAFAMPPLAISMILNGGLRGAGDTRWPFLINFLGMLGVRIPAAYFLAWDSVPVPLTDWVLPGLGWGVMGAWYAMVVDIFVRSGLVIFRFWLGGWKKTIV